MGQRGAVEGQGRLCLGRPPALGAARRGLIVERAWWEEAPGSAAGSALDAKLAQEVGRPRSDGHHICLCNLTSETRSSRTR